MKRYLPADRQVTHMLKKKYHQVFVLVKHVGFMLFN